MATATVSDFIRRLAREMASQTLADHPDRQLVERALAGRDEAALQAIVFRHGPMVYRVCWRVLQHPQDTEDAFQATFLVLARRLGAVRKHTSLASWLHGVAHRVALKAKAQTVARQRHEHHASRPDIRLPDDATWGEVRSALDCELHQLPDNWRLPLILCYLEGRTQDEAAGQLGWSKSTLRRRLEEARAALGSRLTGRGVVWPAALSAVLLTDCLTPAAPTPELIALTAEVAGGESASTAVAALTEGVLNTMLVTKLKTAMAALVIALGVAVGGGVLFHRDTIAAQQPSAAGQGKPDAAQPKPKTEKESGTLELRGVDLDKGTIKGSRVNTNPERTIHSYSIGGPRYWELLVKPTTAITIDGKPAKLADLEGVRSHPNRDSHIVFVEAELEVVDDPKQDKSKGVAIRIEATGRQVRCIHQAFNAGKSAVAVKTIGLGHGHEVIASDAEEIPFAKDVPVTIDDRPAALGDLKPGMRMSLQMSAVKESVVGIRAYGAEVEAVLKAVDAAKNTVSVTVPSVQMTAEGVSVANFAQVVVDGKDGKLSDLKAGMRVTLRMAADPDRSVIVGITKAKG